MGKIRSAGQHLLSLINDILDISKIVGLTAKDIDHADHQQLNGCVQKIFRKVEYGKE